MSKDDLEKAREKIRKLLALSKSNNPNEASVAAARAQEIADRYRLDLAMLGDPGVHAVDFDAHRDLVCYTFRRRISWKQNLAVRVGKRFGVRALTRKTETGELAICYVGQRDDAMLACDLYLWLQGEVDRLAVAYPYGRSARNAFRFGAVEAICDRLDAEAEARRRKNLKDDPNSRAALARLDGQLQRVDDWLKANGFRFDSGGQVKLGSEAHARAGQRAGQRIGIKGRRRLEGGSK